MANPDDASGTAGPRDSKGWDGKLRVDKKAVLANPEALTDPEYSDEDAPPPEQIEADEDLLAEEDPDTDVRLSWMHTEAHQLVLIKILNHRKSILFIAG